MPAPRKSPEELRQRAIRLVLEAREQDASLSLNAAVTRIGPRVGVNANTLRTWCKQAEIDAGRRPGVTTSDAARIKELEREVKKGEAPILLAASSFFARELDPGDRGDAVEEGKHGGGERVVVVAGDHVPGPGHVDCLGVGYGGEELVDGFGTDQGRTWRHARGALGR